MFIIMWFFKLFSFIRYIPHMKFPKPLNRKEERELLLKYKYEKCDEAKKTLIERNLRLVANVAKKYVDKTREMSDLISIGTIGLIKGIQTFDLDKGSKLSTYVSRCIENEILMSIRAKKKEKNQVSIEDIIGIDKEGNELTLIDVISQKQRDVYDSVNINMQVVKVYEKIYDSLTELERKVIVSRFGLYNKQRKTQRQVSKDLNISRSYVSRIEKKALSKLKNVME